MENILKKCMFCLAGNSPQDKKTAPEELFDVILSDINMLVN